MVVEISAPLASQLFARRLPTRPRVARSSSSYSIATAYARRSRVATPWAAMQTRPLISPAPEPAGQLALVKRLEIRYEFDSIWLPTIVRRPTRTGGNILLPDVQVGWPANRVQLCKHRARRPPVLSALMLRSDLQIHPSTGQDDTHTYLHEYTWRPLRNGRTPAAAQLTVGLLLLQQVSRLTLTR